MMDQFWGECFVHEKGNRPLSKAGSDGAIWPSGNHHGNCEIKLDWLLKTAFLTRSFVQEGEKQA
jgi:hypothetical protein